MRKAEITGAIRNPSLEAELLAILRKEDADECYRFSADDDGKIYVFAEEEHESFSERAWTFDVPYFTGICVGYRRAL